MIIVLIFGVVRNQIASLSEKDEKWRVVQKVPPTTERQKSQKSQKKSEKSTTFLPFLPFFTFKSQKSQKKYFVNFLM